MKLLATIKSVEITRTFPHPDGTFGNVYGVTIESGNDTIIAETFRDADSQKRNGIVPGAIGTAIIDFAVRPWTDKQGKAHYSQDIRLNRFDLANQNIRTAYEHYQQSGNPKVMLIDTYTAIGENLNVDGIHLTEQGQD